MECQDVAVSKRLSCPFWLLASIGKQKEKPRKLGAMVGNMAHIPRR
jgi:hypothetical protein